MMSDPVPCPVLFPSQPQSGSFPLLHIGVRARPVQRPCRRRHLQPLRPGGVPQSARLGRLPRLRQPVSPAAGAAVSDASGVPRGTSATAAPPRHTRTAGPALAAALANGPRGPTPHAARPRQPAQTLTASHAH